MTDHAVHEFRLLLSDARVVEDYDAADHLFEAGFDDVTFGVHAGVPFADVSRAGVSLEAVVIDTIDSIEDALAPTVVVRVEPDELVTASRIAERIGRTRQSVALLISGERGPGGFPAPLTFVDAQTRVWSWTEVQSWLQASTEIEVESALSTLEGEFLAALNGVLAHRISDATSPAAVSRAAPRRCGGWLIRGRHACRARDLTRLIAAACRHATAGRLGGDRREWAAARDRHAAPARQPRRRSRARLRVGR